MNDKEIELINDWFAKQDDFDAYFDGEIYIIYSAVVKEFSMFIQETFPGLLGIPCIVDNAGIYFKQRDLKKAISV